MELGKKLGFGFMRLPMQGEEIDLELTKQMVDTFLAHGFCYFDTARGYMEGKSEKTLKTCLTDRYPREAYLLADKLSTDKFTAQEEIRPLLESQLRDCGVEYFDFYLMHAQDAGIYAKYKQCRAYETALELQAEGKFRHFGISFHDKAEVLEQILKEYPQVEVVQLQFNYADYEDPSIESRKCYEVCRKYHKPVIVMEPVKGGCLVDLPEKAQAIFDGLQGGSSASYALRFAAGFEGVVMVLSGMGDLEMLRDNMSALEDFHPLTEAEQAAIRQVRELLHAQNLIPCTDCRYCLESCPQKISIPALFACLNTKKQFNNWNADYYYNNIHTAKGGKASDCIQCGQCEERCPQHLEIRELLKSVAAEFEKKEKPNMTEGAKKQYEKLFPDRPSPLWETDPEFAERFGNFALDEAAKQGELEDKPRFLAILAALMGCQGQELFRGMLPAALNVGLTPVEVKELVYQGAAYLGMGRAYPFLTVTNEVLKERGIRLPLEPQGTNTMENRVETGEAAQVAIFGEGMRGFAQSGPEESRHINRWLSGNCFGDYYTRKGLDYRQRELITFCFLAAQGGCEAQLVSHAMGNMKVGNDKAYLIQVVSQCLPYIGYPRSLNALRCVNEAASQMEA